MPLLQTSVVRSRMSAYFANFRREGGYALSPLCANSGRRRGLIVRVSTRCRKSSGKVLLTCIKTFRPPSWQGYEEGCHGLRRG